MQAVQPDEYYTYADYCKWPEDERWELIDGRAYAKATPVISHQVIVGRVFRQLSDFLEKHQCNVFIAPVSVRLNADNKDDVVVEPDILIVCDESKLADGKGVVGAPDFIVEVLSPSTAAHDWKTKYGLYQKYGVKEYWIADPGNRMLAVNILENDNYVTQVYTNEETDVPVSVLEGCTINLAEIFKGL